MTNTRGIRYRIVAATLAIVAGSSMAGSLVHLADASGTTVRGEAYAVSADGLTVVGTRLTGTHQEAYRWTGPTGAVDLGFLPGAIADYSEAFGVSADGQVVVGEAVGESFGEAYRWTPAGGMVRLGFLFGDDRGRANGVSADGTVIVGRSETGDDQRAFRWTAGGGLAALGELPGGDTDSEALAVSADGGVIVGVGDSASGHEAFRWTVADGMVPLGDLPGGEFGSEAAAVSADGSVIVGTGSVASDHYQAFRWTQAGGMVSLGCLMPGTSDAFGCGVSADGSIVVGYDQGATERAFIWDQDNGMRSLEEVLADDYGVDLTGWLLRRALAITPDGLTIVGWGHEEGSLNRTPWLAYLSDTHYWRSGSGAWTDGGNWTGAAPPPADNHAVLDPAAAATITGPTSAKTVASLTIGGGGSVTLRTGGGDLTVSQSILVRANGTLDHQLGSLEANAVVNDGQVDVSAAMNVTDGFENNAQMDVRAGGVLSLGSGLLNRGVLNLHGGTLIAGQAVEVTNDYSGVMMAEGTVDARLGNYGLLDLLGVLHVTGELTNEGTIAIASGESLTQDGGLENHGLVELDGGSVAGAGSMTNHPGGVIRGGGAISSPLDNAGGLIHADAGTLTLTGLSSNDSGGELRIEDAAGISLGSPLTNSGTICLDGPTAMLSGQPISNSGTIVGHGRVTNSIANDGMIVASGGRLTLAGDVSSNTALGLIEASAGATVLVPQGLAVNQGTVALAGGTFDNSTHSISNTGILSGYGTFRSGGLTNDGIVGVGGGSLSFMGPVVNNTSIGVEDGFSAIFFSPVSGAGDFPGAGDVLLLGGYSPGASPAVIGFGGDVTFGAGGELTIELADPDNSDPLAPRYDALSVAGDVTLAGALRIDWLPVPGDANSKFGGDYDLVTYGESDDLSGQFGAIDCDFAAYVAGIDYHCDVHGDGSAFAVRLTLEELIDGDCDLNGVVDYDDYAALRSHFGQSAGAAWMHGDFDLDGDVDWLDYVALKRHWGQALPPGGPTVPEPATLALLALGAVAMGTRRPRARR